MISFQTNTKKECQVEFNQRKQKYFFLTNFTNKDHRVYFLKLQLLACKNTDGDVLTRFI